LLNHTQTGKVKGTVIKNLVKGTVSHEQRKLKELSAINKVKLKELSAIKKLKLKELSVIKN